MKDRCLLAHKNPCRGMGSGEEVGERKVSSSLESEETQGHGAEGFVVGNVPKA